MSFKSQGLQIRVKDRALIRVGEAYLETIKEQSQAGVTSDGVQLDIDWRDTGALMDTARVNDQGQVEWPVSYAEVVNAVYPFSEVSQQYESLFYSKLQPQITEIFELATGE